MQLTAIVVAAGRGTRARTQKPKQYEHVAGRPVLEWTLRALAPQVAAIVVVRHPDDARLFEALDLSAVHVPVIDVNGADSRDGSVRAGLEAVPEGTTHVLIHDGARCCVTPAVVDRVVKGEHSAYIDRRKG